MPGILIPQWIAWLLVALGASALLGAVLWFHRKFLRAMDTWHPLSRLLIPGARYTSAVLIDSQKLAEAVDRAFLCLTMRGPWTREQLSRALENVRISVEAEDGVDCHCGTNEKVSGVSLLELKIIVVGASLKALPHEFAHVAEFWLEGTVDYQHKKWALRGLDLASRCYLGEA